MMRQLSKEADFSWPVGRTVNLQKTPRNFPLLQLAQMAALEVDYMALHPTGVSPLHKLQPPWIFSIPKPSALLMGYNPLEELV